MGLELELSSELAALRPIRVTAAAAAAAGSGAATARPDDAGVPEESGSATVRQGGGGGGGGGASVSAAAAAVVESSDGCVTPTSAGSALRPATTARKCHRAGQNEEFKINSCKLAVHS
uniref:Uncharacterized protein n=1 Tax=Oryza barthii TaxID=65489 RepID=A0A0D3GJI4_9ORYZ